MVEGTLRVLFVSHTYVVGVNQRKLQALAATGRVDVALVAPATWNAGEWKKRFALERPFQKIRMYPAAVWFDGWPGGFGYDPRVFRRAVAEFRPDLVQVENEVASFAAFETAFLMRATRTPLAVFCWDNLDRPLSAPRRWARRFVLGAARLIIAGNAEAAGLLRRWGYGGPIEVMPQLGVDPALFPPRRSPAPNGEFVIGFVGRLTREKGVDLLLSAADQLRRGGYRFRIVVCGTGPYEPSLRDQARTLGLSERIVWTGAVRHHEVPREMAKLDVLVLPSRAGPAWKEQFGHVLIEAMCMGVPVVGSSSGAIPDVIGRDDLVFREDDATGLAAILERMARDPLWREEIGRYGMERVRERYTDERLSERLVETWQRVLDQQRRTGVS